MKAIYFIALFAILMAVGCPKSLRSGNVLTSIESADKWGSWLNDFGFTILSAFGFLACYILGWISGFSGDNLIGYQKCWAGYFNFFFGGNW